eukprot:TRINITY_DN8161_c0_g1_i1.p1 TRINITY_DN8161_c0_g1~~TRINITY_DN8161_c0_g1_i1.p1  ORF type:complete len:139 (-),score=13.68 TRINITY_DN8161_c0_g1_i1:550-966(-)
MYRSRRMPDYYFLCEIFGDSIDDGREELVTHYIPRSPPSIHNNDLDDDLNADDDATTHNEEAGDYHISTTRGRNMTPVGSSRQTTRRLGTGDAMVAVIGRMADAIDTMSRNTSEERMKKVWETILRLDLDPMIKLRAF